MTDLPPLPEFAKGDWGEVSPIISFDGFLVVPGSVGPDKYTRELFIRGAAIMLYGDRADEIVEHWRTLKGDADRGDSASSERP